MASEFTEDSTLKPYCQPRKKKISAWKNRNKKTYSVQKVHSAQATASRSISSSTYFTGFCSQRIFVIYGLPSPTLPSTNTQLHKHTEQRTTHQQQLAEVLSLSKEVSFSTYFQIFPSPICFFFYLPFSGLESMPCALINGPKSPL